MLGIGSLVFGISPLLAAEPDLGPDVVILDELVEHYQPVPFDHKGHAKMAEMWDGCETCHHHSPLQQDGQRAEIPACKSCHPIARNGEDLHQPNLKGAYHRQCLGCHREWTGANHCNTCHEPIDPTRPLQTPTPAGVLSKLCPPLPEPQDKIYRTRITPAVGPNVLFRHQEHTDTHDIRCASCHVRETCSRCHVPQEQAAARPRPIQRGRTWADSHKPCQNCHETDRCGTCHFHDGQERPTKMLEQDTAEPPPGPLRLIRASERLRQRTEVPE